MVSDRGPPSRHRGPSLQVGLYHTLFWTSDLNEKRVVSDCPTTDGGSRRSEIVVGAVPDADVEFVD